MRLHRGHVLAVVVVLAPVVSRAQLATNTPPAATSTNAVAASGTNSLSAAQAILQDPGFARFTNMMERSLFTPTGSVAPASPGSSGATEGAIAANLRLTGFFVKGGVAQASVEDRNEVEKKYFLKVGDHIGDTEVTVVGFDLSNRAVLLQKGDEKGRIEYENESPAMSAVPGVPGKPAAPGAAAPPQVRPPVVTSPQAGTGSSRMAAGGGDDEAQRRMLRKRNRQQTVDRLRQMLQSTSDPATQQRLQNMITMLERAESQDAAEGR